MCTQTTTEARARERRQFDRFKINLPIEATYLSEGKQQSVRSRSINFSAGGACFPSTLGLQPGTFIDVRIQTPAGSLGSLFSGSVDENEAVLIRSGCEVVHYAEEGEGSGDYQLGVRFSGPMRISHSDNGNKVEELEEITPAS